MYLWKYCARWVSLKLSNARLLCYGFNIFIDRSGVYAFCKIKYILNAPFLSLSCKKVCNCSFPTPLLRIVQIEFLLPYLLKNFTSFIDIRSERRDIHSSAFTQKKLICLCRSYCVIKQQPCHPDNVLLNEAV